MRTRMRGKDHPLKTVASVCSQTPLDGEPVFRAGT